MTAHQRLGTNQCTSCSEYLARQQQLSCTGNLVCCYCFVPTDDPTGSFISQFVLEGSKEGPLAGQRVAVKDLYHVSSTAGLLTRECAWVVAGASACTSCGC